ncbi:MAG: hypothetical protein HY868_24310 [Chloroflexi bacterium]|nr:hypothetical protein [Chloroflexota bacterium]
MFWARPLAASPRNTVPTALSNTRALVLKSAKSARISGVSGKVAGSSVYRASSFSLAR